MKVFLIFIFMIYFALFVVGKCSEVERLKEENKALRNGVSAKKHIYKDVPEGTVEAVKYAMKHAHPDNGGNTEDFIRFQKIYEELTR